MTCSLKFHPDGRPCTLVLGGKDYLDKEKPGDGFVLRYFDGIRIIEETLPVVRHENDKLIVTKDDDIPRFTFRIVNGSRYLALHLIRIEGVPLDHSISLGFNANLTTPVEVVDLDRKVVVTGKDENLTVIWPYFWHRLPDEALGAFALYAVENDTDGDFALAEIWANEPLPRPAGQAQWTVENVMEWVDAYHAKFAGMSEITLSAATPEELYYLTGEAHKAGIRRIYLHTDTWRGEYWPRKRSHVDVNPAVFPGGRPDLIKYSGYLHDHGMLLRLHNVSGGIGWHDPKRIVGHVERDLASWGGGALVTAIGEAQTELLFRPDPATMVPYRSNDYGGSWRGRYMAVNYLRIENEIIQIGAFADLDNPVWRLLDCQRAQGGTQAAAHDAGSGGAGLYVPYRQNLIPDLDSPFLAEIADEYAALVNEASLDHIHFDGREIHDQYPWGWKTFTDLVFSKVEHAVTSSTSGAGPIPANFEMRFSAIRKMHELDYHGVLMPIGLSGHREATSMLDTHFCIQAMLRLGTRRVVLQKPEPMFGVTREMLETHGLASETFELAMQWMDLLPHFNQQNADILAQWTEPNSSSLRQGARHYQSRDVLVLEADGNCCRWVPNRVMARKEGDVPWRFGQEHGAIGPRQFIKPGDILDLTNPYVEQEPRFILHIMSEFAELDALEENCSTVAQSTIEDDYALGVQRTARVSAQDQPVVTSANTLQPLAAEVENQRFALLQQDGEGILVHAANPTMEPIWFESDLPEWKRSQTMTKGRGLALEIDGDGSGAVLLFQLHGRGTRDYVVKINFTGRREIVIPNGEVAWADGNWGYRIDAKHFDYDAPLHTVSLGFGYIPPRTSPRVRVARLRTLADVDSELCNPIITIGSGSLSIKGKVATGDYLKFDGGDSAQIYDCNWNHKRDLPVEKRDFTMPEGEAKIHVTVSDDAPRPWISTQFITRGEPIPLAMNDLDPESNCGPISRSKPEI
jgi:hypothetical protein